ncbi:MAG: Flp family type IVb pilin [Actinomycetota bacterium]|jgi:Flp pilus assembly pilin Flp
MSPANRSAPGVSRRARWAVRRLFHAQEGASAVEYAILLAMIAAVVMVVVKALGVDVHDLFDSIHF